jgi:uncharacterized membrane protein YeaQ/YmgE (transglycosylase-associated protein family)
MIQPKWARRILVTFAICSLCARNAYAWSSASLLRPSIKQEETIMSIVGWMGLGLAAGFIGSQLVDRNGRGILPDILLGLTGAMVGGWLYYTFGPAGVNGLNLLSHFAALICSVVILLSYYALSRIRSR